MHKQEIIENALNDEKLREMEIEQGIIKSMDAMDRIEKEISFFTIVVDIGKPFTIYADGNTQLKEKLKEIYHKYIKDNEDDYLVDIIVFDGYDCDITESNLIESMIAEIEDEGENWYDNRKKYEKLPCENRNGKFIYKAI